MRRKFRRQGSGRERNSWGGLDRGKIWEVGAIEEHRQECLCHERHEDEIGRLKVAATEWGTECVHAFGG
jgi:hypothetical protein